MKEEWKSTVLAPICVWVGNAACTCLSKGTDMCMHAEAIVNFKCHFSGTILFISAKLSFWFRNWHIRQRWQTCGPVSVSQSSNYQHATLGLVHFPIGSGDQIQSLIFLLSTWLRYFCSSSHSCMLSSQYPISTEFHDLPIYGSSTILKALAKNGCYISQWLNGDFFNVEHHPFKPGLASITEKMPKHILSNIKD